MFVIKLTDLSDKNLTNSEIKDLLIEINKKKFNCHFGQRLQWN